MPEGGSCVAVAAAAVCVRAARWPGAGWGGQSRWCSDLSEASFVSSARVIDEGVEGTLESNSGRAGRWRLPSSSKLPCVSLSPPARCSVVGVGASQVVQVAEDMPERGVRRKVVIFRYMEPKRIAERSLHGNSQLFEGDHPGMSQSGACSLSTRCSG